MAFIAKVAMAVSTLLTIHSTIFTLCNSFHMAHTTTWKFILGRNVRHVGSQQVAYTFSLSFIQLCCATWAVFQSNSSLLIATLKICVSFCAQYMFGNTFTIKLQPYYKRWQMHKMQTQKSDFNISYTAVSLKFITLWSRKESGVRFLISLPK